MTRAELIDQACELGLLPGRTKTLAEFRLAKLEAAVAKIEDEDNICAAWAHQWRKCGKADCQCMTSSYRHGPYLTLRHAQGGEIYLKGRKPRDWKRVYIGPLQLDERGTVNLIEEWERVLNRKEKP